MSEVLERPVIGKPATLTHEVRRLAEISDKPSLVALSYALRHREVWPAGFEWDYRQCRTCAMGLSVQLWTELSYLTDTLSHLKGLACVFEIDKRKAYDFFICADRILNKSDKSVAPEDIADMLDAYLATAA